MCQTPAKHCTYKDAYDPHPSPEAHSTQGPCSLHSCLLALRGSLSLAFFSVPLPEIPDLPPVLLWERAQQKATMVAMRTRKATPAPTATPMMTAIGTDSVGEKQAQLTRGPTAHSPPGPHPVPSGAAPCQAGARSRYTGSSGKCPWHWQWSEKAQAESNRVSSGGTWGRGEGGRV